MQVTVYAKVENIGWVPQYFDLVGGPENASPADFTLTVDQRGQKSEKSITAVEPISGGIRVVPEEFSYNQEFTLTGSGAAEGISLTKKDVSNVEVEGMDKFAPLEGKRHPLPLVLPQSRRAPSPDPVPPRRR